MVEKKYGRKPGAGRPPVDLRRTFEAIIWILKTGAPWRSIPEDLYPSYQSCRPYFRRWTKEGLFKKLMRKVRRHPLYGKDIRVKEMFYLDGSFAPSKKGRSPGCYQEKKDPKIMVLADEKSRPVSVIIASASVHEVRLAEEVIRQRASKAKPRRITADRAYDSDVLDKKLKRKGIELNAPHCKNRRKSPTQDGRKLRAYRRRWKVERLFA